MKRKTRFTPLLAAFLLLSALYNVQDPERGRRLVNRSPTHWPGSGYTLK